MGKRHRQSVLKKRDEKHGKKSVETGHDAKHEVSVTKKGGYKFVFLYHILRCYNIFLILCTTV